MLAIELSSKKKSLTRWTIISTQGAGASPVPTSRLWGHGSERPLLRLKGRSTLMIRRSMLSDAAAKGVGCSEFSRVTLEDWGPKLDGSCEAAVEILGKTHEKLIFLWIHYQFVPFYYLFPIIIVCNKCSQRKPLPAVLLHLSKC